MKLESTYSRSMCPNSKQKYYNASHPKPACPVLPTASLMETLSDPQHLQNRSDIFIDIYSYLHSGFLQSIEKINSITFIVTSFITVCIISPRFQRKVSGLTACDVLAASFSRFYCSFFSSFSFAKVQSCRPYFSRTADCSEVWQRQQQCKKNNRGSCHLQ